MDIPAGSNPMQGGRHVYPPGVRTKIFPMCRCFGMTPYVEDQTNESRPEVADNLGAMLQFFEENLQIQSRETVEGEARPQPEAALSAEELGPDVIKLVAIGPNGTTVPMRYLKYLDWSSGHRVAQDIVPFIFDQETLATHSLSGKVLPALDPLIVADIVHMITEFCNCSPREVQMMIATQCADGKKMLRMKRKREQVQDE